MDPVEHCFSLILCAELLCLMCRGEMEPSRMDEGVERLKQLKMEQIRDQQNTPCSRCAKPALSHRSISTTSEIRIENSVADSGCLSWI